MGGVEKGSVVLSTALSEASKKPGRWCTRTFNLPTRVENLNASFVFESLLKFLKVEYEIKGKEFNLQIFASNYAPHLSHFILAFSFCLLSQ